MTGVTVWLLVSIGFYSIHGSALIERFPNREECQRVLEAMRDAAETRKPALRCIQATVVKP